MNVCVRERDEINTCEGVQIGVMIPTARRRPPRVCSSSRISPDPLQCLPSTLISRVCPVCVKPKSAIERPADDSPREDVQRERSQASENPGPSQWRGHRGGGYEETKHLSDGKYLADSDAGAANLSVVELGHGALQVLAVAVLNHTVKNVSDNLYTI